jgi:hypothetical protein
LGAARSEGSYISASKELAAIHRWCGFSLKETMLVNTVMEIVPFFALGALGIATFVVALSALRSALRAKKSGEDRVSSCCAISKSASGCCAKNAGSLQRSWSANVGSDWS